MSMIRIPAEVFDLIISLLDMQGLRAARSVNRAWNATAVRCLFHSITLLPNERDLDRWHSITSDARLSALPRHATINSSPLPDYDTGRFNGMSDEYKTLCEWNPEPGLDEYKAFYDGIDTLSCFPALESATLHFMSSCKGTEYDGFSYGEELEDIPYRTDILTRFFSALQQRRKTYPGASKLKSLTIENLQNVPLEDFTTSSLFKSVMNDVEHLNLIITEECNEHGPDWDIECIERRTFPPYLINHWLKPFSSKLKSISLEFPDCWGSLPGYFDAKDLDFAQLEKLTLSRYCIAHDDSIDWILRQKSLKSLHLNECQVVTYIRFYNQGVPQIWSAPTHDWESLVNEENEMIFFYPGTCSNVFDRIRNALPKLSDVSLSYDDRYETIEASSERPDSWTKHIKWGERVDKVADGIPKSRYVCFDHGILPTQWIKPEDFIRYRSEEDNGEKLQNREEETRKGDAKALRMLLSEASNRRKTGRAKLETGS